MATFNIPGALIVAGAVRASASRQPGANFNGAVVTLTDPNGDWPATIDNTRHILQWGFQQSEDDVNWEWGPVYAGDMNNSEAWLPFGWHGKNGGLPYVGIDSSSFVGGSGTRLRLAILTDANVRLGAQIVTT